MSESSKQSTKSFFETAGGILTGVAALITAITGLIVVLNTSGCFKQSIASEDKDRIIKSDSSSATDSSNKITPKEPGKNNKRNNDKKVKPKPVVENVIDYKNPITVTVNRLVWNDVDDDDEDMEFSFNIDFLGKEGSVVGTLYGENRGTYVQEPKKVGESTRWNIFFSGGSFTKTVSQPVYKLRFLIKVRSHDNDSKMPWADTEARYENTYSFPEFTNPIIYTFFSINTFEVSVQ